MFPIHFRTASGLEEILAQELKNLGLQQVRAKKRFVTGLGNLKDLYRANLWARTAIRILRPIANFTAPDEKSFYDQIKAIDWSPWLKTQGTLAIDAHVHSSFTTHSLFLAQLTKDAIADQFREKTGDRPSVDLENPDLRIAVNLFRNQVEVSVDSSGDSLHKRGYRKKSGEAPLNECLAAGILLNSNWAGEMPLVDPMTGSGTLAIEAGLIAKNVAPGLFRTKFGFQNWSDYDPNLFNDLVLEAQKVIKTELKFPILAFDKDSEMIKIAQENIERAGLNEWIRVETSDFFTQTPSETVGIVVMNPPYDERLEVENLAKFCQQIGNKLRSDYKGWTAFVLMGNSEAAKEIASRPDEKFPLFNGAIGCELLKIKIGESSVVTSPQSREELLAVHPKWEAKLNSFSNRLKKNLKHYSKWAQRERLLCWRVYDRDIPELPFILDFYGRFIHFAEVPRNHDHSPLEHVSYLNLMKQTAAEITQIPEQNIFLKTRKAQKLPKTETTSLVEVKERNHRFLVNFVDYVDVGLFLEYRKVREWIEKEAKGKDFLNLFSYTGTATVCAAAGGAKSTGSVDASSTYIDWAKKNMDLNEVRDSQHIFYRSDVMEFLNSSKKFYDYCWVDPPVNSVNRTTGKEFNVQEDHVALLLLVLERIKPQGKILFTTNCQSFEFKEWAIKESAKVEINDLTHALTPTDFERTQPFKAWVISKQ